jgi:general secretion pathway protein K
LRSRERGVVLILVMGAVAVLAVIAVELASRATTDVLLATRASREAAFRRISDSGIELAKGLLREPEAKPYDSWGERWNQTVRFTLSETESAEVQIADESGKINLVRGGGEDAARRGRTIARVFEYLRRHEPGRTEELRDVEARVLGRLGLLAPREGEEPKKPDPLVTLDGLRESGLLARQIFGEAGIHRYFTCFGDGKVNVNTAPRAVLYALDDEINVTLADRIAAWRGDAAGKRGVYRPFEETKDLQLVDGIVERNTYDGKARAVRNLYTKLQSRISTRSTCFSIRVDCRVGDRSRTVSSFFEPAREEKAGEKPHRTLKAMAYEDILP